MVNQKESIMKRYLFTAAVALLASGFTFSSPAWAQTCVKDGGCVRTPPIKKPDPITIKPNTLSTRDAPQPRKADCFSRCVGNSSDFGLWQTCQVVCSDKKLQKR
jgi:hypothetical protein